MTALSEKIARLKQQIAGKKQNIPNSAAKSPHQSRIQRAADRLRLGLTSAAAAVSMLSPLSASNRGDNTAIAKKKTFDTSKFQLKQNGNIFDIREFSEQVDPSLGSLEELIKACNYHFDAEDLKSINTGNLGKKIAKKATQIAIQDNNETHCFRSWKKVAASIGLKITGIRADDAVEQLQNSDKIIELNASREDYASCADGLFGVHERSREKPSGHIFTTVNGRDASSKIRNMNTTGKDAKGKEYGPGHLFALKEYQCSPKTIQKIFQKAAQEMSLSRILLTVYKEPERVPEQYQAFVPTLSEPNFIDLSKQSPKPSLLAQIDLYKNGRNQ